jgi:MFS family permease
MSLWLSASAVIPQLSAEWGLSHAQKSWMTMSVQIGFVLGALLSAFLNLPDRISSRYLFSVSAFAGALANGAIPLTVPSPGAALVLRFLTGVALAGVYPPCMKLVATWCKQDRGFGIGLFIGALTLGLAVPHLLNALPVNENSAMPPWRTVLLGTSALATVAGVLALFFFKGGPYLSQTAPFDWRFAGRVLMHKPTRLANFGYFGHNWELFGMWTWVPLFLIASYERAQWSLWAARFAGFCAIAVGAVGCVLAGRLADRMGRTKVSIWSLFISGSCAVVSGFFFGKPGILTALCIMWGFAINADSAQYSTAITELTDSLYVGTALTVQTCLGFLLTSFSIWIIGPLTEIMGWERVFTILAIGPVFGIWSMLVLRRLPEAARMASGNR